MFRFKPLAVAATLLLVVIVAAVGFTACKKKAAASSQGSQRNFGNFDPQAMEQQYQDGLAELVQAGTITQEQSDKIYAALTERFSSMASGASRFGSRPSGASGGNWASGSRPEWNGSGASRVDGSRPSGAPGGGGQFNPLSSLVSDGTITQAQADAVMQKLMGGFGGGRNSASSQ